MTLPTTLPRSAGDARWAAYGMRTCATIELIPTTTDTARNTPKLGARPAASSAAAVTSSVRAARARFSSRSPSGTSRNRPMAYPSWVRVTTSSVRPWLTPKVEEMRPSSGCE